MTIGDMIRIKREEQGLTQQELAQRLYVSRQTVSRWESGSRCPDVMTAKKIAAILGVTLDELVPGEAAGEDAPVRETVSGTKKMLRGMFLLILSVWCMVFAGFGNAPILTIVSLALLVFAIGSFFMGYYGEDYTIDGS